MKLCNLLITFLLVTGCAFSQDSGAIISFEAARSKNTVIISWTPSMQPETNHFEIQRSQDSVKWRVVALMFPFEDGTVSHTYKYADKLAPTTAHYRIRLIDVNKNEYFSRATFVTNAVSDK